MSESASVSLHCVTQKYIMWHCVTPCYTVYHCAHCVVLPCVTWFDIVHIVLCNPVLHDSVTLCYTIWQVRCKSVPTQAPDPEIVVTALRLELRTLFLRFTLANAASNYSEHFSELALRNAMVHQYYVYHISPTSATIALFYSSLTSTVDASLVSATMGRTPSFKTIVTLVHYCFHQTQWKNHHSSLMPAMLMPHN